MAPSHIGRYEIQRRLGAGGMGALYLARDPALDRLVALKVVKEEYQEDAELRERFKREARSVARLNHRNIIIIYEIGEADGRPFIAMEYIAGETLTNVLRRSPPVSLVKRLSLIEELCDGLAHAHGAGIIHRDIKPANIMLDGEGVLKILDFGIARLDSSGMTREGMMMGTVNYMSPEQIVGSGVDHRTDIFAIGAVMYEVITFEQAFPGRIDSGVLHRILNEGPQPIAERHPGVDPELVRIINHALERDPGNRYQDLIEMRRDVSRVRLRLETGGPGSAAPQGRAADNRTTDRRRVDSDRLAVLRRQQVEEYLRFGEEAFAHGEHDAAIQNAERALIVDPENRAAHDLVERARFAIEAKALRQLLAEANRLLSAGHVDDAAALAEEASVTLPDLSGAPELVAEIRGVSDRIGAVRERERQIKAALDRARSAVERGEYDSALRAVYEVLSIDPEQRDAREVEDIAKSKLQAQRTLEIARQTAYEQLNQARALAADGKYDEAINAINGVVLPTHSVRVAAAEALATVRKQQRHAVHEAVLGRARAAVEQGEFEQALRIIDEIPAGERTAEAVAVRASAEDGISARRALEQKRQALHAALDAVRASMEKEDFADALEHLDEAAKVGLDDARIPALRQQIADLERTVRERRRQEARDRVAAKKVEGARQLLANGNLYAAQTLLDRDDSGHPLVAQALGEIRAAIAEQEERVRREAERRRQEEEAKRRAELEAARREEERRKAEQQRRRRDELDSILAQVEAALAAQRTDEAAQMILRADNVGAIDGDSDLTRRVVAAKAEVERQRRVRAAEARAREEELRRQEQERRQREDALTVLLNRVGRTSAHQEALDLLEEALTLAPGDARVEALIAQRREALQRERDEDRKREEARRREEEARRIEEERRRREEEARRREEDRRQRELEARRIEEAKRAAELEAATVREEQRRREEQQRAAEKAKQEEERRERELTKILTRARQATEHEAALTLLNEAATIAPGDPRVRTLIAQRSDALKQQEADQRRRAEEQRRAAEQQRADAERRLEDQRAQERRTIDAKPGAAEAETIASKTSHLLREEKPPSSAPPADPLPPSAPAARAPAPAAPAPPRDVPSGPSRRLLYVAAAAIVALLVGGVLMYRPTKPPAPATSSGPNAPPTPQPEPRQPPRPEPRVPEPLPDAPVEQQVQARLVNARALMASGQAPAALSEIQLALGLQANHAGALALRDQMVNDATSQLQRAKQAARDANADKTAAKEYAQAAAQERAAQRERQAGRVTQALPLFWNARAQFLAATEAARAADQAARELAARDQASREQAARDQAARDQAAKEQAAKDQAARDQAAREQAQREQAARDQAARDQAARDQAAREQAAREQAVRDQARAQQLDEAAVLRTLRDYEAAFTRRDADAVARIQVLSGQQVSELRKSMAGARAYTVTVQPRDVKFNGDRRQATVTANVARTYVPLSGAAQNSSLVQTFVLERRGDGWVIATLR